MHYEQKEYASVSMAALGAHLQEGNEFAFTEEGVLGAATALSMTYPAGAPGPSPTRRGSTNAAYSNLMRRGSTGVGLSAAVEAGEQDPMDSVPIVPVEGGESRPAAGVGGRGPSFLSEGAKTFGTFDSHSGDDQDHEQGDRIAASASEEKEEEELT
jgi:hypothetical protein